MFGFKLVANSFCLNNQVYNCLIHSVFVNILILIEEKESIIKDMGYRWSWGVEIWPTTNFEGPKEDTPEKNVNLVNR